MKKNALYILFALGLYNTTNAQINPAIFDPAACGCTLEVTRFADTAYTNKLKEPFEDLNASFVYNGKRNEVAIGIINSFRVSKNQSELIKTINETVGQINQKPKEKAWLDGLKGDMETIANPSTQVTNWKPYTYKLACLFTERMHGYYTQYPDQALPAHRDRYEPPVVPVNDPNNTANTQLVDASPTTATADTTGSSGILFWVVVVLALGGWAFGLMQRRQIGALHQQVLDAQQKGQQVAEGEKKAMKTQISELEEKNMLLSGENADLKRKLALAEQELTFIKNKAATVQQPSENKIADAMNVRYLYAPTSDGVFYRNNIREQADSDTLYKLIVKDPAAQEAEFSIILNEEILRRADSMAQQLLMPACDLIGKGKMPFDLHTSNIRNGRLRREGEGWRIVEKIKISW